MWDRTSLMIFQNNPNIAAPGSERAPDLEWINFQKGHRIYNRHDPDNRRWIWNYEFRPTPGEIFFDKEESRAASGNGKGFIVIEPGVEAWKSMARNKQWEPTRYEAIAKRLTAQRSDVVQFVYRASPHRISARQLITPTFRQAIAILANAALYIGPEGGLHHAAAALGVPAIVLFGGFVPPTVTGYPFQANLTGGATVFCGSLGVCDHCLKAMAQISVDEVWRWTELFLSGGTIEVDA